LSAADLTADEVLHRVDVYGDLHAPLLETGPPLPGSTKKRRR
jgi:hypothetical protein